MFSVINVVAEIVKETIFCISIPFLAFLKLKTEIYKKNAKWNYLNCAQKKRRVSKDAILLKQLEAPKISSLQIAVYFFEMPA